MPLPANKSYHQMVAQNFLRNISLDGSHEDTSLRIFKERGLHFAGRHRDLSISPPPRSTLPSENEESSIIDIDRFADDRATIASKIDHQKKHRLLGDHKASLDSAETTTTLKQIGKGYSIEVGGQQKQRRRKQETFRERLMSAGSGDFEATHGRHGRHRRSARRYFQESMGDGGLFEKLKAPFSQSYRRHDGSKSVSQQSSFVDHSTVGRSVKWGALPAVASLESVATRASIMSTKGGEVVVVDGDFSDARAKGARICLCRKQLPVMICSILPFKRTGFGTLLRRLEPSSDSKSLSSMDEAGLKPFNFKDDEISYSPILVPSRSYNSMMSSDTLSYFATSGPSSSGSAYDGNEQQSGEVATSNFLSVEGAGQSILHKHDVSIESDLTMNRSSLVLDFRSLDDPEFGAGKHKTILTFPSYMTSLIEYVNRDEMKREVNEKFRKKFPEIRLTFSKYQSLKRDMKSLAASIRLDLLTLAQAYSYFDTIVLKALISKTNRKLVAAACLLLAAKMNDVKGADLKALIHKLEETFRLHRKEFVQYELPVAVALEFGLHVPMNELSAQYKKLLWST